MHLPAARSIDYGEVRNKSEMSTASSQDSRGAIQPDAVLRKLNMHIMTKFCLLVGYQTLLRLGASCHVHHT